MFNNSTSQKERECNEARHGSVCFNLRTLEAEAR